MSSIASTDRRRLAAVALTLTAVLLAGCMPDLSSSAAAPERFTVIVGSPGINLNPYTNVLSSRQIGGLLFRGLFSVGSDGMPLPDLALEVPTVANGGISDDRLTVTYHLDPAAVWADGEALTAHDVVFTWDLIASGVLQDAPGEDISVVRSVEAVDDQTVRLTLGTPHAPLAWRLVPYVLPKHLLEDATDVASDDFWFRPVGSRGFLVDRHLGRVQVDLKDPQGVRPSITVVFTASDEAARTVWEGSQACVWLDPPLGPAGSEQYDAVASGRWQAFVFNMSEGRPGHDEAVRQAFSHVATTTVQPGDAGPYGLPIPPLPAIEDNAIEAALDRAGWKRGTDGQRARAGIPLEIYITCNAMTGAEGDRIEAIDLERYGIFSQIRSGFEYTDYASSGPVAVGDYDVGLLEFPIGIPFGWAWPYRGDGIPGEDRQQALNCSRVDDGVLNERSEAMRAAGDPASLQAALAGAWERLGELGVVVWDEQKRTTVLFKGLEGVKAQPFEEQALAESDTWRLVRE